MCRNFLYFPVHFGKLSEIFNTQYCSENFFSIGTSSPRQAESNGTTHGPNLKSRSEGGRGPKVCPILTNRVPLNSSRRAESNGLGPRPKFRQTKKLVFRGLVHLLYIFVYKTPTCPKFSTHKSSSFSGKFGVVCFGSASCAQSSRSQVKIP